MDAPFHLFKREEILKGTPTFRVWVTRGEHIFLGTFNPSEFFCFIIKTSMILPQVHLRKPCYDFSFL